jgi:hypothetical protein
MVGIFFLSNIGLIVAGIEVAVYGGFSSTNVVAAGIASIKLVGRWNL